MPAGKPKPRRKPFRIKRAPGGKIIESADNRRLYVSREGRALLAELGGRGKALLRGEVPLKKEPIAGGTHGHIYKVTIAGKDFALKKMRQKGEGVTENGVHQMQFLRGYPVTEGPRSIERPARTYLASDRWLLMELAEGTLLKNIRRGHPLHEKLMEAMNLDKHLKEAFTGLRTNVLITKYHERTGKFELVRVDLH